MRPGPAHGMFKLEPLATAITSQLFCCLHLGVPPEQNINCTKMQLFDICFAVSWLQIRIRNQHPRLQNKYQIIALWCNFDCVPAAPISTPDCKTNIKVQFGFRSGGTPKCKKKAIVMPTCPSFAFFRSGSESISPESAQPYFSIFNSYCEPNQD